MLTFCGCWYPVVGQYNRAEKRYLPQVDLESHTTILGLTSRTILTQTFINDSYKKLDEVQYSFPLYDGVSVVGFKCTVGQKTIVGVVKEKQQARADYDKAVSRGETAGLLEQLAEASDVFTTKVGNVPAGEKLLVEIIYLGELKHDAEADGARFTIPTAIAPRYGPVSHDSVSILNITNANDKNGIRILVDVALDEQSIIRGIQSPSHPIAVTMGRTSVMNEDAFDNHNASATLTLASTELGKDFIIVILLKEQEIPRALLETHPTIPNQRALMTTLVPKFNIPNIIPEIVFVIDRSGSMAGKIPTLVSAMKIFLKSLPANGVKFNICSFGSSYSFLFKKSRTYDQSSLKEALHHLEFLDANMGGTEMLEPIKATAEKRYKDMALEVMILTDGEIWNQEQMFNFINAQKNARFFSLGIGAGASTALVEGIARAGNGFAQFVTENEKMDKRVVRMLKGALTPHIADYSLEVHYAKVEPDKMSDDDDFEMVESFEASTKTVVTDLKKPVTQKVISLFNPTAKEEPTNASTNRFDGLPNIDVPKILQTPHKVPNLFSFNRTTVYLLLGPDSCQRIPKSVVLKGTSEHGPLELEIQVQDVGKGETIHQLAAKKAVQELEEGRGWITEAKFDNRLIKSKYEGRWDLIVEREAIRLGVQYQVGGKWCSFVAVEKQSKDANDKDIMDEKEINEPPPPAYSQTSEKKKKTSFSMLGSSSLAQKSRSAAPASSVVMRSYGGASRSASRKDSIEKEGSPGGITQQPTGMPVYARSGGSPPQARGGFFSGLGGSIRARRVSNADNDDNDNADEQDHEAFSAKPRKQLFSLPPRKSAPSPMPPPPPAQAAALAPTPAMPSLDAAVVRGEKLEDPTIDSGPGQNEFDDAKAMPASASVAASYAPSSPAYGGAASPGFSPSSPHPTRDPASGGCWYTYKPFNAFDQRAKRPSLAQRDPATLTDDEKMHLLIEMQEFDGSWNVSPEFLKLLGNIDTTTLAPVGHVEATALAVAWLETKMKKEIEVWEMIVEKARDWLQDQGAQVDELVSKAKKAFS